jgi:hypothetical protein
METAVMGLRMLGCSEALIRPLMTKLMLNVAAEGPENVIKRIKVIKRAAIATLAGEVPQFTWIRSKGGKPAGAWKPVWKWLLSTDHEKREHAFNILMVYTSFFHSQNDVPTRAQLEKFIGSVQQPPERVEKLKPIFRLVPTLSHFQRASQVLKMFVDKSGIDVATRYPNPPFVDQVTALLGLSKDQFGRTSLHLIERAKEFISDPRNDVWLQFPQYREVMQPFLEEEAAVRNTHVWTLKMARNFHYRISALEKLGDQAEQIEKLRRLYPEYDQILQLGGIKRLTQRIEQAQVVDNSFTPPGSWVPSLISRLPDRVPKTLKVPQLCGNVAFCQEAGFKMRAFASPFLPLQFSLKSLKDVLFGVLRSLPWDCCFDQRKGVERVKTWLDQGKTCYSVDLSDATNNASWIMQEHLLRELGVNETEIALISSVNSGLFRNPWFKAGYGEPTLQWTVGQPLGAGPSFAIFSLFHAYLVLAAMAKVRKRVEDVHDTFVILGDDIVINDQRVHHAYRDILELISAPVSEAKCLESRKAAEFAGVLITSNGLYRGWKFKDVQDDNFMSIVEQLGVRVISRSYLTPRQYKVAEYLRDLPKPYGLGHNSKGLPYQVQCDIKSFLDEWRRQHELQELSKPIPSRASSINRLLYGYGINAYRTFNVPWLTEYLPFLEDDPESRNPLVHHAPLMSPTGIMRLIMGSDMLSIVTKGRPGLDPLADWKRTYLFGALPHIKSIIKGRPWESILRELYPNFRDFPWRSHLGS